MGIVITLSAVGSTTVSVVSYASAVEPSNIILESVKAKAVAVKVVIVGELIVGLVKVLFVNVWVPVVVTVPLEVAIVIELPEAEVSIPVPPAIVSVSLFKSIAIVPLSEVISKSWAVIWASTYALIDCWVATFVAEFESKPSSSKTAEPETAVFNTALVKVGLVKVLFVKVCVAVVVTTVPVASGKVIVLSAVGSVIAKIVS